MIVYLILFFGLLNWSCFMSSRVLMSLYAIQLGASPAEIGVLIALYGLGPVTLSVHSGKISDRYGSFRSIAFGSAGLAIGLMIPFWVRGLAVLYVAAFIIGAALVYLNIAVQHLVASLGDAEARTRNISLQGLAVALSGTIGPLLVGVSIDHQGHVATYLYLSLIVALACAGWVACRRVIPDRAVAPRAPGNGGIRDLFARPALRRIIVVSGLVVAGLDLYTFYVPIYGHGIGLSATTIGIVLGAQAAAMFIVRAMLPWLVRRWGEERVMSGSMYLAGATFLLFPFVTNVGLLLVLSFMLGLGLGCGQPLSVIMTYNRSPAGRAGEALGARFSVINLTHMVIPLTFGTLGSALGLVPVFLANSALMFGGGYANARGAGSGNGTPRAS